MGIADAADVEYEARYVDSLRTAADRAWGDAPVSDTSVMSGTTSGVPAHHPGYLATPTPSADSSSSHPNNHATYDGPPSSARGAAQLPPSSLSSSLSMLSSAAALLAAFTRTLDARAIAATHTALSTLSSHTSAPSNAAPTQPQALLAHARTAPADGIPAHVGPFEASSLRASSAAEHARSAAHAAMPAAPAATTAATGDGRGVGIGGLPARAARVRTAREAERVRSALERASDHCAPETAQEEADMLHAALVLSARCHADAVKQRSLS